MAERNSHSSSRAGSSVVQSGGLIIRWSLVRIQAGPQRRIHRIEPRLKTASARYLTPRPLEHLCYHVLLSAAGAHDPSAEVVAMAASQGSDAPRTTFDELSVEERVALSAYTAGVIDSDGSIGILRETHAVRAGRASQATFSERVTIRQVEPEAVDLLHSLFGGCRGVIRGRRANQQPLNSLQLVDRQATRILMAALPYLRIKRGQADLCVELRRLKEESRRARFAYGRGHRGGAKRPESITNAMEAVRAAIIELNKVQGRYERHRARVEPAAALPNPAIEDRAKSA